MHTIVLATGGFDPIHSGHIAYLDAAKQLGDMLIVGVNSDSWLQAKKGRYFMPWKERHLIVQNIRCVDRVIDFDDRDGSAKDAIRVVRQLYPESRILFVNGGDRNEVNIPEMSYQDDNLQFEFGVGGTYKANSSSWLLEEWKAPKTRRQWGYYRVLHEDKNVKVKELTVDPGAALSMQRHQNRSELWLVSSGVASVYGINHSTDVELNRVLQKHDYILIDQKQWHQLVNEDPSPLRIVEIQFGSHCDETDIERQK